MVDERKFNLAKTHLCAEYCFITEDDNLQDSVNLPNVAKLFWSHADEERSHAIQFMQYLRYLSILLR